MNMRELNYVNTEGGPLLLVDAKFGHLWTGIDGSDYDRACEIFNSNPLLEGGLISIGDGSGLLWEMSGAGTAHVFSSSNADLIIVRTWPINASRSDIPKLMANEAIQNPKKLGCFNLISEFLLILWAAENGDCVEGIDFSAGRPSGEMAIDTSGAIVKLAPSRYECWHDEIKNDLGVARRCFIYKK